MLVSLLICWIDRVVCIVCDVLRLIVMMLYARRLSRYCIDDVIVVVDVRWLCCRLLYFVMVLLLRVLCI